MTIILDSETTGLRPRQNDILQLAMLDDQENVLFNEYIKPTKKTAWPDAEVINKISPDIVKDKQPLSFYKDQIQEIINKADAIIGYNLQFDLSFLILAGIRIPTGIVQIDVMHEFAPIYGEWNDFFESYKWQKLITAAYYGYDGGVDAHDALADTRMTLFVHRKMNELNDQLKKML